MYRINFGRPFIHEKSNTFEGYNVKGRGLCFWMLVLFIQDKIPVKKRIMKISFDIQDKGLGEVIILKSLI